MVVTGELPVENPANGRTFATARTCPVERLDDVVAAAAHGYAGWSTTPFDERRTALIACGAAVAARIEDLAGTLTREQGKPLREAWAEAALAADWFGLTAGLDLAAERLVSEPGTTVTAHRIPRGVVAAVAPSNFPLILSVTKLAPALLAGNTVVLKPSPVAPLAVAALGELLNGVLPPGVVQVVVGGADLGAALTGHREVRMVSFTGSTEVGRQIARGAAGDFRHVVLELGGNDACVVLPGTDIAAVAGPIYRQAMVNSGQFCAAIKRVYVHRDDRDELVEALRSQAVAERVGDGLDPATDRGPLATRAYRDRAADLVATAVAAGARLVAGGPAVEGPGHFYRPTVVADLPPGTALEACEQFGPIVPVIAYDDVATAVDRANATGFALGGSVWGDPERAAAVAPLLDCGTTWINGHGRLRHDVPFGGFRESGTGVEYGRLGLLEYTRLKVVDVATPPGAGPR